MNLLGMPPLTPPQEGEQAAVTILEVTTQEAVITAAVAATATPTRTNIACLINNSHGENLVAIIFSS